MAASIARNLAWGCEDLEANLVRHAAAAGGSQDFLNAHLIGGPGIDGK